MRTKSVFLNFGLIYFLFKAVTERVNSYNMCFLFFLRLRWQDAEFVVGVLLRDLTFRRGYVTRNLSITLIYICTRVTCAVKRQNPKVIKIVLLFTTSILYQVDRWKELKQSSNKEYCSVLTKILYSQTTTNMKILLNSFYLNCQTLGFHPQT